MPNVIQLGPVEVCAPDDEAMLRYSEQAVQDVLNFFSLLCFGSNEWAGEPFQLLDWELEAIRGFYGIQEQDEEGSWSR